MTSEDRDRYDRRKNYVIGDPLIYTVERISSSAPTIDSNGIVNF